MISAIILTRNEEGNIADCLKTLKWCDEIIVIDDYSCDETRDIAEKLGAKVLIRPLNNDFAEQRNYGLEKAKNEWVFFIDADERVTIDLKEEILSSIQGQGEHSIVKNEGFILRRNDFLFGKWLEYGESTRVKLLRLAKKGSGKWVRSVHETWQIRGKIGELKCPLIHYPHPTVKHFLEDINFYTTLNAKLLYGQGVRVNFCHIIFFPIAKFVKNYFFNLGFLDGIPGFMLAVFMSFHSFLTRAKLWFFWKEKDNAT